MRLSSSIPSSVNHKLFYDNWFNSPELQVRLAKKGIQSVGTLNIRRAPGLQFHDKPRKQDRGSFLVRTCEIDGVTLYATHWFDNRSVYLLSSYVAHEPVGEVERYDRKKREHVLVSAPNVVFEYNRHMGYVDELNSYIGRSRLKMRFRKRAYLKMFVHFANLNYWLLYRRDCDDCGIPKRERLSYFNVNAVFPNLFSIH